MTVLRVRVTRDTPVTGAFQWVRLGSHGGALAAGVAGAGQPPVSGDCEVVLDGDLVSLERVTMPASQQRRIGASLRYLAEEFTLSDPERVHVAAAPGPEKNSLCLGIVDRQWFAALLERLRRAGLSPRAAYPESLTPALAPLAWIVAWRGQDGFVRTGENEAFALDLAQPGAVPTSLRLALDQARSSSSRPRVIIVRCARDAEPPDVGAWSAALDIPMELGPDWHWAEAQRRPGLDLMQGEFAARGAQGGWTARLRRAGALAAALVALASIGLAIDWAAKARERDALLGEMRAIYRDTFGEKAVIVDPPLQMRRALADLRRQAGKAGPGDFPVLLGVLSEWLPGAGQARLDRIEYDARGLTALVRGEPGTPGPSLLASLQSRPAPAGYDVSLREGEPPGAIAVQIRPRARP
jgi:general secretion pathway protein L